MVQRMGQEGRKRDLIKETQVQKLVMRGESRTSSRHLSQAAGAWSAKGQTEQIVYEM